MKTFRTDRLYFLMVAGLWDVMDVFPGAFGLPSISSILHLPLPLAMYTALWVLLHCGLAVMFWPELMRVVARARRSNRKPLTGLLQLADLLPLPTRKKVEAMAGDYAPEITRMRRQHRRRAAAWNVFLAWATAFAYVFGSPIEWAIRVVLKISRGG